MFKKSSNLYETAFASICSYNLDQIRDIIVRIRDALAMAASVGRFTVTIHITADTDVPRKCGVQYITDIPKYTQDLIGVLIKPALIDAGYLLEIETGAANVGQMSNTTLTIHIVR